MTTKPLTKSSAVGSLVTSLAEPAAKAVGEFLRDTAGEAIQGTYKWGRDRAYDVQDFCKLLYEYFLKYLDLVQPIVKKQVETFGRPE